MQAFALNTYCLVYCVKVKISDAEPYDKNGYLKSNIEQVRTTNKREPDEKMAENIMH